MLRTCVRSEARKRLNAMDKLVQADPSVNRGQSPRAFIYYDPDRFDYAVTPHELRELSDSGRNFWKDFCLVSSPLGVTCALNAAAMIANQPTFKLTLGIFLNSLVGLVGIALAICFAILWHKCSATTRFLVNSIKEKPRMQMLPCSPEDGTIRYLSAASRDPH